MRLQYFRPSARLAGLVTFHYGFETPGPHFGDMLGALLGQLQFRLAGGLAYASPVEGLAPAPSVPLMGPLNGTMVLECAGPMRLVGCGLLPAGWARLVGASAAELADRVTDARALWGPDVDRTHDAIANVADPERQVALLDGFLCRLLDRRRRGPDRRIAAIDDWIGRQPAASLDDLMALLDMSQRQVERIVAASHGAPKLLASKYRILRASALLATGQAADWRDAAGDVFADQAHFIRQFRRFIGQPPVAFAANHARLARLVMRSKWDAGARSPLALWS